jgi:hypothetical protein
MVYGRTFLRQAGVKPKKVMCASEVVCDCQKFSDVGLSQGRSRGRLRLYHRAEHSINLPMTRIDTLQY